MWKIIGAILILIVIAILALAIYFKEKLGNCETRNARSQS